MNSYISALLVFICAAIAFIAKSDAIGIGLCIVTGAFIINAGIVYRK